MIVDGLYPQFAPSGGYLACGSSRITVARISGRTGATVHLADVTDVGQGLAPTWLNPSGSPTEQLLYYNGASHLLTVNTPPPFVAAVLTAQAFNALGAGGGVWMGFLAAGLTVRFSDGAVLTGRLEVPAGPVVDQDGRGVYLAPEQQTLYQRTAAGVVSVVDVAPVTRPHVSTQGICWQRFEGGQQITYGQRGSGIERVHVSATSEFWSIPVDTPVGPWILTHNDTTLFLRAWGRTDVTVVHTGVSNYPHAIYSSAEGGFYVTWSDIFGVHQVTFVALDVNAVAPPGPPNPIPGGGGGGSGLGGSVGQSAGSLTVAAPTRFTPPRRAIYPHVDQVEDRNAQATIKLLWDRLHTLNARLDTGDINLRFATVEGAASTLRTRFETQIPQLTATPGEALATSIPGGGGGIPGGDPGNPPPPPNEPPPGTPPLPMLLSVVQAYAAANPAQLANSCQSAGGTWDFLDGALAALRQVDPRFGYNGKRGNPADPSHDAISYYWGPGVPQDGVSRQVYIVDIIGGHCGPNPTPTWTDQTAASVPLGGVWITRGVF